MRMREGVTFQAENPSSSAQLSEPDKWTHTNCKDRCHPNLWAAIATEKKMFVFTLVEQIGKGSFGTVNRIRRKSDGRIMVCKEITYGKMSDKEKQMLVSEVNILRELKHPNIVRYYDR